MLHLISNLQYTLLLLILLILLNLLILQTYLQYTLLLLIQQINEKNGTLKIIYNTLCYY